MNETITFRSVTPLFNFVMEEGVEFRYEGRLNNVEFAVTLKRYPPVPESAEELMKYADERERQHLNGMHMAPPGHSGFPPTEYFLVADFTHPAKGLEVHGNTYESVFVNQAVLDSLRINASKGIVRFTSYHWRSVPSIGFSTSLPMVTPARFSLHLGHEPSVFASSAFNNCRAIAGVLATPWDDTIQFDKVLREAMSIHGVTFALLEPKHSFLLLWIIFEALFRDHDEDTAVAVKRLSHLLARDKNERRLIARRFEKGNLSFTKIRNSIVHGDVSRDSATVKKYYPGLYSYITRAITELLLMKGSGEFNLKQEYLTEISRVSQERYKGRIQAGAK